MERYLYVVTFVHPSKISSIRSDSTQMWDSLTVWIAPSGQVFGPRVRAKDSEGGME